MFGDIFLPRAMQALTLAITHQIHLVEPGMPAPEPPSVKDSLNEAAIDAVFGQYKLTLHLSDSPLLQIKLRALN